jgi:hypothetical protein
MEKHLTDAAASPSCSRGKMRTGRRLPRYGGRTSLVLRASVWLKYLAYLRTDPVATFSHAPRSRFGIQEGQPNLRTSHHQQT